MPFGGLSRAILFIQVNDPSTGNPFYECLQYADLSYSWGPIQLATVKIGGDTASQLPGTNANSGLEPEQ